MAIAASLVGYVAEVEAVVLGIHRIFVQLQTCATNTTPTPKKIVGVSTRFVRDPLVDVGSVDAHRITSTMGQPVGGGIALSPLLFFHALLNIDTCAGLQ
jgi:hypothetical protein